MRNSKTRPTWAMRGHEQTTYHVNSKDEINDGCDGMNEEALCSVMIDEEMDTKRRRLIKDKAGAQSGLSSIDPLYDFEDSEFFDD